MISYNYIYCNYEDIEELQKDSNKVEKIIFEKAKERLTEWMCLLLKEVDCEKVKTIVMPGNDDSLEIDPLLMSYSHSGIYWCLDKIVDLNEIQMISLAQVNPTPWNTPREADESNLTQIINELAEKLDNPQKSIFNFHAPPYRTRIDLAPELDKNKKPIPLAGEISYIHAGSKAVRNAIEEYQPLLGLHGHIHESPGVEKIGKTICINPGSEYSEGILRGYIIEVEDGKLRDYREVKDRDVENWSKKPKIVGLGCRNRCKPKSCKVLYGDIRKCSFEKDRRESN